MQIRVPNRRRGELLIAECLIEADDSSEQLGLDTLKKRAVTHLTTQLSMQTYLHELFSEFTSRCAPLPPP